MYKYNDKDAAKITTEILKGRFNISSRNAAKILKSSVDLILYDISAGETMYDREEIYNSIASDLRFNAVYYNGYGPNIAHDITDKIIEITKE